MDISSEKKKYEQLIHKGEVLKRLLANPDFKEIIENDYFGAALDTRIRLLSNAITSEGFNTISRQISAIGSLKDYLETIAKTAIEAENDLESLKRYEEELESGRE